MCACWHYYSQGFAKIHDEYKFPMRLELDQFVEEGQAGRDETEGKEGLPSSTKPKNNFILHSVLIHAVR